MHLIHELHRTYPCPEMSLFNGCTSNVVRVRMLPVLTSRDKNSHYRGSKIASWTDKKKHLIVPSLRPQGSKRFAMCNNLFSIFVFLSSYIFVCPHMVVQGFF